MSQLRLPFPSLSPAAYQGLLATNTALAASPLGLPLLELVYLRISQINGCAFCLGKHAQTLRESEVAQEKLDCLAGWRISELFNDRERAALAWAEALTRIEANGAADADYAALAAAFDEREQAEVTFVITSINTWNRFAVGFRAAHPIRKEA